MPITEWVIRTGLEVVPLLSRMEQVSKVTANTFKVLEGFRDPQDYSLMEQWLRDEPHPTAGGFQAKARRVLMDRYWRWVLTHPDLQPDHMHWSRRVFTPPPLPPLC